MLGTALVRCSSETMTDWRSKAPRPKLDQELKNIMDREPNMPTYQEMLEQKRASVREVSARESARLYEQGAVLVDIREQDEVDQGIIPGAVHPTRIPGDADRRGCSRP